MNKELYLSVLQSEFSVTINKIDADNYFILDEAETIEAEFVPIDNKVKLTFGQDECFLYCPMLTIVVGGATIIARDLESGPIENVFELLNCSRVFLAKHKKVYADFSKNKTKLIT